MADKDILRDITDKITAYYTSRKGRAPAGAKEAASVEARSLQKKVDGLLQKEFEYGLERQRSVSELFDQWFKELQSLQASASPENDTEEAKKKKLDLDDAQRKALETVRDAALSYAQHKLLEQVSSAQLTDQQTKDEKDNFVISGEGTFKPGSTLREKRTLQKILFLTVAGDDKSLKFSVDNAHGFLTRPRAREMLISAVVKTYQDPEYAGGTFTLTDGTITDAERIINGLIKAGANCRIAQLGVQEWSQPIERGSQFSGGNIGHNDKWTHSGAINALDALNKKIAEHNRLLNPSASKDEENNVAHVRIVHSPSSSP